MRCTSLTPPPIPPNVALISSTETVGARFDSTTLELAVPAIEIAGDDNWGEDKDFVSAIEVADFGCWGVFRGDWVRAGGNWRISFFEEAGVGVVVVAEGPSSLRNRGFV
jgi:hypothetical protein